MREGADIPPCKFNFGVVCANGRLFEVQKTDENA